MASVDANKVYEGFAQVAHAIRRTKALEVATLICEPGTSEADLLATADRLATWIRGGAEERQPWKPPVD